MFTSKLGRILAIGSLVLSFVGATLSIIYQLAYNPTDFLIPAVLAVFPILPIYLLLILSHEPVLTFIYIIDFPAVWIDPIYEALIPMFPDVRAFSYSPASELKSTLIYLVLVLTQAFLLYCLGTMLGKAGRLLKR